MGLTANKLVPPAFMLTRDSTPLHHHHHTGKSEMKILHRLGAIAAFVAGIGPAAAQNPPQVSTKKVEGTENVYIFRYGGHQSMFVVTPQGVIATDPISYERPAKPYIDAIKAVTDKPIKYVIYSHHHYDHAAGGQA